MLVSQRVDFFKVDFFVSPENTMKKRSHGKLINHHGEKTHYSYNIFGHFFQAPNSRISKVANTLPNVLRSEPPSDAPELPLGPVEESIEQQTSFRILDLHLDIQSYLLRFGVLGLFLGSKYRTSGGGPGCLGDLFFWWVLVRISTHCK